MIIQEIKKKPEPPVEAGAKDATADAGPAAAAPAKAVAQSKPRVLVVDDELGQFVYAQLRESEPEIEALLGDVDAPEVEKLLQLCGQKGDVAAYAADPKVFQNFLMSDAFVQEVLLTDWFRRAAGADVLDKFSNFFTRADRGKLLREEFDSAFPPQEFQVDYMATRPSRVDALAYDFIFLDLVLVGGGSPVDELKAFLKDLSDEAGEKPLPPIVAMSTAEEELTKHRQEFSKAAQISAAGLWILPKSDLGSADFKARGLRILFDQLVAQCAAAQSIRAFIRSWSKALKNAADMAETTLWNLDAAAIQRVHITAITDNDPFDGHLGDLISREYLWHVERDRDVAKKLGELDSCFRANLNDDDGLKTRFMSPIVNPEVARAFFARYVWSGWPTDGAFYGPGVERPEQRFNSTLPFGSVLASELKAGGECLVHVTQQCDLNASTRSGKAESRSALFAIAEVHEALPHHLARFDSRDLVAVGLKTAAGAFDLQYAPGRVLAMPIGEFLQRAENDKLVVVGRLRFDVAAQFAQATANQLTRPAAFKMARDSEVAVKAFLLAEKLPLNPATAYLDSAGVHRSIAAVRAVDQSLSFQDEDGMRLAIWLERMLIAHCGGSELDLAALSNKLRVGVKAKQYIVANVRLELHYGKLDDPQKTIDGLATPKGVNVKLVLVADESTKPPSP
jgi:hypothetical protein